MAEVAASIIGISTFGIKLTLTLYDFGCTTASAKQQTDHIAKHVTLYSNVLELLAERLEADSPIISEAAIDLVEELYEQSEELFERMRALLPRKDGRDEISFVRKLAWNFNKTKVDLLIGELEYLKSTTQLLVTVIFTGKRVQSYRKRKDKVGEEQSNKEREAMNAQCRKAQVVIVEQTIAVEQLPALQKADNRSEALAIEGGSNSNASGTTAITLVTQQTNAIAQFQESLSAIQDASQRQAMVLQHSTQLLHDLLQQWTHLDRPEEISASTSAMSPNDLPLDSDNGASQVKGRQEEVHAVKPTQSNSIPAGGSEKVTNDARTAETQQRPAYLHAQAGRAEQPAAAAQRLSSRYASQPGEKTTLSGPLSGRSQTASARSSPYFDPPGRYETQRVPNPRPRSSPYYDPPGRYETQQVPLPGQRSLGPKLKAKTSSSSSDDEAPGIGDGRTGSKPWAEPRVPKVEARAYDRLEASFPSSNYTGEHCEDRYIDARYTSREDDVPNKGQDESRYKDLPPSKPPRRRRSGKTEQSSVHKIDYADNIAGWAAFLRDAARLHKTLTEEVSSRSRGRSGTHDSFHGLEEPL